MGVEDEPGPSRRYEPRFFDFNRIPEPAAQKIFSYLRYDEIRSLQDAVPSGRFDDLVNYGEILLDSRLRKSSNFIWHRFCEEKKEEDRMAPRVSHSMIYHEAVGAVYIFGGRTAKDGTTDEDGAPRVYDEEYNSACFNDLWKLDLATMVLSRVCVTSTPYPLPKCGSSMALYNDEILLFGGRRPIPRQTRMLANPNTNELHFFSPKKNSWRKVVPINESPSLFGHSAVVAGDLFITFGGTLNLYTLNTTFRVLNLKKLRWFVPRLPGVPDEFAINGPERVSTEFPIYGAESSSLVVLKPGHLLLLGDGLAPSRRHVGVIISYDPENPEGRSWTWRIVPAIGKWFECLKRVGPSRHRNSDFAKVVPIYGQGFVRLVTVGLPSLYFQRERAQVENNLSPDVDPAEVEIFVDGRCGRHALFGLRLIRAIQDELEVAWKRNGDTPTISERESFSFDQWGVHVEIKDLLSIFQLVKRGLEPTKITVRIWRRGSADREMEAVDTPWLISLASRAVDFFFARYAQELQGRKGPRPLFVRRRRPNPPVDILQPQPHLVSYSALIPLKSNWSPDDITEIKYEEGRSHYFCPPTLHDFAICATRAEVVIHGGELPKAEIPQVTYMMMSSGPSANLPSTSRQ